MSDMNNVQFYLDKGSRIGMSVVLCDKSWFMGMQM